MRQLSVHITKPLVLRHEDGHSDGGKERRRRGERKEKKHGEDGGATGNVLKSLFSRRYQRKEEFGTEETICRVQEGDSPVVFAC